MRKDERRRQQRPFEERDVRLLVAIGHQVGVAVQNARLWQELKEKERARSELLEKLISAQEEERQRIARELHDDMAQGLTALLMGLARLEHPTTGVSPEMVGTIDTVKQFASQALDDTRRMILDLRPAVLDDLGLVSAVRLYAQSHLEPLGVAFTLEAERMHDRLAPHLEVALFRILQEAINNCARHARAEHVRVRLEHVDGEVRGTVEDDGVGFDVWATLKGKREKAALGLLGMRERAALIGGSLDIESEPGRGTRLRLRLPLEKQVP
ncbi:MAG: GAF domain-containing sensor histidine kinase [Chloroflexota bacterium]|nr:GAF domain-containing sensor histidine kinase [Chloroflexota bacterium]